MKENEYTDKICKSYKLGELFCGPGGIGLAAKQSQVLTEEGLHVIEHAWATDYDKDTCATYTHNICPNKPESVICKDIRKLDMNKLASISSIDGLAFGFPCNDFSIVGEQKGIDGVYGPLYQYGIQCLQMFKPKWFLAENVGGLRNANEGKTFKQVLASMVDIGYRITPHLYKFEKYGIPQTRHRIIIVGIRLDQDARFKIPSPTPYCNMDISAKNAIENPPIPYNATNNEKTTHSRDVIERLKHIKAGENAFNSALPEELKLRVKGAKISQIYKRLHPDLPSYTVTGSGGGGTHVYHWSENRALTNRERARLQTFPDDFFFFGSKESVRKQIGMAVPVSGAQIVLESILKTFAHIPYPSLETNLTIDIGDIS